jgi:AraC-like DNA-binding protein
MRKGLNHFQDWPALAQEAKWSSATLAKKCNASVRTLHRHFLASEGKSPKTWLAEARQQYGRRLLRAGFSVKETAALLLYNHPTNFARRYKHFWGVNPSRDGRDLNLNDVAMAGSDCK